MSLISATASLAPIGQVQVAALDELIAWATGENETESLKAGRSEIKGLIGEMFEDDRQVELRMASFLEWFVCDRMGDDRLTPAERRYRQALQEESPVAAARFFPLVDTVYDMFEVSALTARGFVFRSLMSQVRYSIVERRSLTGIEVGAIAEARLFQVEHGHALTPSIYWHPPEAARMIRAEAMRRRGLAGSLISDFVFACASRSLKAERYRQIAIDRVYDFHNQKF